MVKKIFTWVLLVLLVGYVVAAAIWARGEAGHNVCNKINIDIVRTNSVDSLTAKGVLAEIRKYPDKIIGEYVSAINTRNLTDYLLKSPQFENVLCNFNTNGILTVTVTPMVPELRVFEDSLSYYINKDGKKMASKASYFVDVPVVSGKFDDKFPVKNLLPLTRFISADPALSHLIGMVKMDTPDNIILVPRIQGHVINFGDTSRMAEKRNALIAMYRKVIPYKGWYEYDTISVKFKGQVVATRRNKGIRFPQLVDEEETDMEEATLPDLQENTDIR